METSVPQVEPPSKRRSSTINNQHQHGGIEMEWTAARCNRLLRALTSRVAILKKDISLLQAAGSKSEGTEFHTVHRQKRVHASPGDADWGYPRKRAKKTYSVRGRKTNNRNRSATGGLHGTQKDGGRTIPEDISVPTPLLHRVMREIPESQSITHVPPNGNILSPAGKTRRRPRIRESEALFQLSRKMREIRKSISPSRYITYEGIYYGLEGLLKVTTASKEEQSQKGPPSLLSICLRAVPHYIVKEEIALEAQLEETGSKSALYQRDVSTEIYDDLEAFGSSQHGWKHLKTVVRSHGIQVLCTAISERLIDTEFCGILISLCISMNATREAEILLSSLLSAGSFTRPKSIYTRFDDDDTTRPFSMLWNFAARKAGSSSYQYRQLSRMISDGSLPTSWLGTKAFVSFWGRGIREFTSNTVDPDAIAFFTTSLPLLAVYGDAGQTNSRTAEATDTVLLEAVNHTFSSLISTLLAIVIINKGLAAYPVVSTPDYKEILTLLRACLAQWNLYNSVNIKDPDLVGFLLNRIHRTSRSTQSYTPRNDFAMFLYSIARCCGRGASNSGFEYMKHLHELLESLVEDRESHEKQIVGEIIVDSAFAFARQAPDRSHLEYAVGIEEKFHVMKVELAESSPYEDGEDKDGYRWEEGISEWVIATPAASSVKSASSWDDSSSDDSEGDIPIYHMSGRPRPAYRARSTFLSSLESSPDACLAHSRPSSPEYDSSGSESYDEEERGIATPTGSRNRSVSFKAYGSDEELLVSPSPGQDLETDELCMADPRTSRSDTGSRRYSGQAPRSQKIPARHSLHWQVFDESDDELSCLSTLFGNNSPLQPSKGVHGASSKSRLPSRARKIPSRRISTTGLDTSFLSDSEDELGI